MSGPGLREVVSDIREAVERMPREALVDVLVHVFKEYVVQGPVPTPSVSAMEMVPGGLAGPAGDVGELRGLRFAELVRELQLRLDVPELELFEVQGERVMVRLGGRLVPIEAPSSQPAPAPVPPPLAAPSPPIAAPAPPLAPAASQQRPAAPQQSSPAPLPSASSPAAPAAAQQPAPAAGPAAPPPRRRLLEID